MRSERADGAMDDAARPVPAAASSGDTREATGASDAAAGHHAVVGGGGDVHAEQEDGVRVDGATLAGVPGERVLVAAERAPHADEPGARSCVYWIRNGARHYIGATVDAERRLRQHNGELAGGAQRTSRAAGGWRFECVITGFRTWREALQFEWAFQHHSRRCRGVATRAAALERLLRARRWTTNAPLAAEVPLRVLWHAQRLLAAPSVGGGVGR